MTPKQIAEAQLAKARRILGSAEKLLALEDFDGAASRAYFASFQAVRAALATVGVQPQNEREARQRLLMDLVSRGKVEPGCLSDFATLQTHREIADYALDMEVSGPEAARDLEAARKLVERMARLVAG